MSLRPARNKQSKTIHEMSLRELVNSYMEMFVYTQQAYETLDDYEKTFKLSDKFEKHASKKEKEKEKLQANKSKLEKSLGLKKLSVEWAKTNEMLGKAEDKLNKMLEKTKENKNITLLQEKIKVLSEKQRSISDAITTAEGDPKYVDVIRSITDYNVVNRAIEEGLIKELIEAFEALKREIELYERDFIEFKKQQKIKSKKKPKKKPKKMDDDFEIQEEEINFFDPDELDLNVIVIDTYVDTKDDLIKLAKKYLTPEDLLLLLQK